MVDLLYFFVSFTMHNSNSIYIYIYIYMDQMINYIQLACVLKAYKTYDSMVEFSKYKFNNKLLGDITLHRITPGVT